MFWENCGIFCNYLIIPWAPWSSSCAFVIPKGRRIIYNISITVIRRILTQWSHMVPRYLNGKTHGLPSTVLHVFTELPGIKIYKFESWLDQCVATIEMFLSGLKKQSKLEFTWISSAGIGTLVVSRAAGVVRWPNRLISDQWSNGLQEYWTKSQLLFHMWPGFWHCLHMSESYLGKKHIDRLYTKI